MIVINKVDIVGLILNAFDLTRPQRTRAPAFLIQQQIKFILKRIHHHTLLYDYQ